VSAIPATRLSLLCALAVFAALLLAAPAAEAKKGGPGPRVAAKGICAVQSGAKRPSPVRACRGARKAPKALPSARRPRATARAQRKLPRRANYGAMMG